MADAILPFALLLTLAVAVVSAAALRAWRQWLEVRRLEIVGRGRTGPRAEVGELRRRVRHLEALASGIEI
jgi:transposase-like protein